MSTPQPVPELPDAPGGSSDPFRTFRSRRGRAVASVLGVLSLVIFLAIAVLVTGSTPTDGVLIAAFGIALAFMCWRYATIRVEVSREGLVVRNLLSTRHLAWSQVVKVQFGADAPWVTLDLDDTDQLAVMAIQRADGPASRAEASRLAALVQALGEARR